LPGRRWLGTRYGFTQNRPNPIPGPPSAAAAYHEFIQTEVNQGLTAQRIWQDLGAEHGYGHSYLSVQRYVRRLKQQRPEVADVMEHPPGAEAQVDYFQAPVPDLRRRERQVAAAVDLPNDLELLQTRL
jgi:transposase